MKPTTFSTDTKRLIARMVADKAQEKSLTRIQRSMLRNPYGPQEPRYGAKYVLRWLSATEEWLVWEVNPTLPFSADISVYVLLKEESMTEKYTEHWVIAWNQDGTYYDFVRCHPSRSQDEAEAFRDDERGLSSTVEDHDFADFAAAQAAAGKRIDELEKAKRESARRR